MTSLKLNVEQLSHLQSLEAAIRSAIEDFGSDKPVKYFQNLEHEVYVGVQTPYTCVNIRKFWTVPETLQLHPTKVGIPLSFQEFETLMNVIEYLQKCFVRSSTPEVDPNGKTC